MPIPLCMAVTFGAKKRLSSPLWVGSVESPVSPDRSFTVFDPSNNVEFLVDTGSPISLLSLKDFASCDHYSGLQTLSAINNTPTSIHGTKHLQVQLPTGVIHSHPWTFKVANLEMAILGCDFLVFHGLQLDFTEMLLVDHHVIGSHDERVFQGSRLNKAEERFRPQPSINEVDNLSITHDINVLPAEKTATTDIGVGSVGRRRSYEDLKRREFFQPSSGWFI